MKRLSRPSRRFLLVLTLCAGLILPVLPSQAGLVSCITSFFKEKVKLEGIHKRVQCYLDNCWILAGETMMEQLIHETKGTESVYSTEAIGFRRLQVQTFNALLNRGASSESRFAQGGNLPELLELVATFGVVKESDWRPIKGLEDAPLRYRQLTKDLNKRIDRYHQEVAAHPTQLTANQAFFEAALDDCMNQIREYSGVIPAGSKQDALPASLNSNRSLFRLIQVDQESKTPASPSDTTRMMKPVPRWVIDSAVKKTSVLHRIQRDNQPLVVPARYSEFDGMIEAPFLAFKSRGSKFQLWEAAIYQIETGKSVWISLRVGKDSAHAIVATGLARDKNSLKVSHLMVTDSNASSTHVSLSRSEFLSKVDEVGFLIEADPNSATTPPSSYKFDDFELFTPKAN